MRDEDQRGDRQAEVTQLGLQMAFVEREDMFQLKNYYGIILICTKR